MESLDFSFTKATIYDHHSFMPKLRGYVTDGERSLSLYVCVLITVIATKRATGHAFLVILWIIYKVLSQDSRTEKTGF